MSVVLTAQQASSAFDVVSIKPNVAAGGLPGFRSTPGGRVEMTGVTIGTLVTVAFERFPFDDVEVINAPDWVGRDRYDIVAQAATPAAGADIPALLRALLTERFSIATHWETRERDVYALVVAHPDRPLGPGLKHTEAGCEGTAAVTGGGPSSRRAGRGPSCTMGGEPGNLLGNAVTVEMFGRSIGQRELHRRVIDRTGITGSFDIDLHYRPDLGGGRPGGPPPAPPDPDAPSIFTAIEEQLGLRLVADRAPVDVLVIDRIERPAPN
jgi:uncharacterized protein (TIGR03435 family)